MKAYLIISLVVISIFVPILFINAYAVDNNCPVNVVHILQVANALRCIEARLDALENASSGEANTASNLDGGIGWFKQKVGVDLQFKSITAGNGITLNDNGTTVRINSTGGSGEANTASCDGYTNGECLFAQKSGVDLQFKRITSANSKITITSNSSHVIFTDNVTGESTVCTNLGTSGVPIFSSGNCDFRKLISSNNATIGLTFNSTNAIIKPLACTNIGTGVGTLCNGVNFSVESMKNATGISIVDNGNDITVKTFFVNGTGISITSPLGTSQIFTNTGVISGSCTSPVTCSGTNPLSISCATCDNTSVVLLCSVTITGGTNATIVCPTFAAKKNLMMFIQARPTGGTGVEPAIQFNSNTGNNYAFRTENNGGADATTPSTSNCAFGLGLLASGEAGQISGVFYDNQASERKIGYGQATTGFSTSAATAPFKIAWACKFDNTTVQITGLKVLARSGTGSFNIGSVVTLWGWN